MNRVIQSWIQVHFFRELFYFMYRELRPLFNSSVLFLAQTEQEMDSCFHCSWAADKDSLSQMTEKQSFSLSLLKGSTNGCFFLCVQTKKSLSMWKMGSTTPHTTSPDMWQKESSLPSVPEEQSQCLTPAQVARVDCNTTQAVTGHLDPAREEAETPFPPSAWCQEYFCLHCSLQRNQTISLC